jgi:hypothetical protein
MKWSAQSSTADDRQFTRLLPTERHLTTVCDACRDDAKGNIEIFGGGPNTHQTLERILTEQ